MVEGRAGHVDMPINGMVFADDLKAGLVDIPADQRSANAGGIRANRQYSMQHHGACQCWIPAGAELVAKNHMSRLRKNLIITKK